MDPQLLQQLMAALGLYGAAGYDKAEPGKDVYQADADKAMSVLNALAFNQGPKIEAATDTFLSGKGYWSEGFKPTYDQALAEAYARKTEREARSPTETSTGSFMGSMVQPATYAGSGPLSRIALNAALTGLEQSGEQGAGLQEIGAATAIGGGLTGFLESLPLVGKATRWISDKAGEAGLGAQKTAARKAAKNVTNKGVVKEGYALFQDLLKSGQASKEDIAKYKKVFQTATSRREVARDVVEKEIDKLVDAQIKLVNQADSQIQAGIGATGAILPKGVSAQQVSWVPDSFNEEIAFLSGKSAGGTLNPKDFKKVQQFEEAYKEALDALGSKWQKGGSIGIKDLLQAKKAANATGLYSQTADDIKRRAYTAAISDLNSSIAKTADDFAAKGLLQPDLAKQFQDAGQKSQKLISFKSTIEASPDPKKELASISDLLRAGIAGSPVSIALWQMGVPPEYATAVGAVAGSPSGMGAISQMLDKGIDIGTIARKVSDPVFRATIRTQAPLEGQPEQNMSMPQQAAPAAPQKPFLSIFEDNAAPTQPAAGPAAPNSFLSIFDTDISDTSSPANGDLPSQQLGLKQDVSLSQPDRFGGLAQYYAALAQTESSLNPMAQNPNSSAKGLFQFVDDTAARVGVTDPFDINQQLAGVQKLTEGHRQQFGDDPYSLYAAHFLGQPTLQAWQSGQPLQPKQQQWVQDFTANALPRFAKQYQAVQQPDSQIYSNFMNLFS